MPCPISDRQLKEPTANYKPAVVGLYGVPGSGKTFLVNQLKQNLKQEIFEFYEGSKMIDTVVPGGLDAFQKLGEQEKLHWRQFAIGIIKKQCADSGKVAVVAGHFMFWPEEDAAVPVYTQNDLDTYTHILYLDVPAEVVAQRRLGDAERSRPSTSVTHLRNWQQAEKDQLRDLCRQNGILFSLLSPNPMFLNKVLTLLQDFSTHTEKYNLSYAESMLDMALVAGKGQLESMLVMDADRTLAAEDTGALFWKKVSSSRGLASKDCPLKTLFSGPLGHSYTSFRQATLLYEETVDDQEFDALCQDVASSVTVHPEFVSLLKLVAENEHVGAVIVTCGLRRIWEKVLERLGLRKTVEVIGGGRLADGYVVTASVKGALVDRLRDAHQVYVWAFGDSPLDLEMLRKADQAVVVVGEEQGRSKSMDTALTNAIENDGFNACQAVLPSHASPRLDTKKLPLIQIMGQGFIDSILRRRSRHADLPVLHATHRNAAKLLMTPMRDANLAGPVLRDAHTRVGWYLGTQFLTDMIGTEEYHIPHVQGHLTNGYRLLHEKQTLIVALMRGGEPMALGVSEAFPLAMFLHASCPEDIKDHHVRGKHTVILVDSVVNSGKTVVQFARHLHNINATIQIMVVAGVIQAQSLREGSLAQIRHGNFGLVALRLSDNMFTGRGTTDTGNRLFNTTHLP